MPKSLFRCPGSKKIKRPEPESILCPDCKTELEIWSDETKTTCKKCSKPISRRIEANCLDWCKFAETCVGTEKYHNYKEIMR